MIVGIGFDLASVKRMERIVDRFGDAFLAKILTEGERNRLPAGARAFGTTRAAHIAVYAAGRFAAKEALVKALGTGFSGGVTMHDVQTLSDAAGKPRMTLSGRAEEIARSMGVNTIWLSISHERDMAGATVVLEA